MQEISSKNSGTLPKAWVIINDQPTHNDQPINSLKSILKGRADVLAQLIKTTNRKKKKSLGKRSKSA